MWDTNPRLKNLKTEGTPKEKLVGDILNKDNPLPPSLDPKSKDDLTLDNILSKQLLILFRVTNQLAHSSVSGLNKEEIMSLATCIKVTMDLKAKENELLDDLSDEELEKIADSGSGG